MVSLRRGWKDGLGRWVRHSRDFWWATSKYQIQPLPTSTSKRYVPPSSPATILNPPPGHDIDVFFMYFPDEVGLVYFQLAGRMYVTFLDENLVSVASIHAIGRLQVRRVTFFRGRGHVGLYVQNSFDALGRVGSQWNTFRWLRAFLALVLQLHELFSSWPISSGAPLEAIIGLFRWFWIT